MVIRGEPDPATATLSDWVEYRDYLRSLSESDDTVDVALAIANSQIQKLRGAPPTNLGIC
jgi:hypothetical protein